MRESLHAFCVRTERESLLGEWDAAANLPLTPQGVSYGSKQKVWWQCSKGHRWQAAVFKRTGAGTGCPVCAGRRALAGQNDLLTRYPDLARQWHPEKNQPLTPDQVLPGSHRAVWWVCEKGHVWRAQIKSRVAGCGCPVCANRTLVTGQNDLQTCFPALAAEWHPSRNGSLTPQAILATSKRKVWWRCEKGHAYAASISVRVRCDTGCPVCAGKSSAKRQQRYQEMLAETRRKANPAQ